MNRYSSLFSLLLFIGLMIVSLVIVAGNCPAIEPGFHIQPQADRLVISLAGKPVATYVFRDETIPRPYFAHVHVGSGQQVTRNHPPVAGVDSLDHATFHPGIWMAFGDLSGCDFWRNKDPIIHEAFVEKPQADDKQASFAVRNRYQRADGTLVCRETCRFSFINSPFGCWLLWDSVFDGESKFTFGDQEEMGLGMRVSTAISVKQHGTMLDSENRRNEKEIWGNSTNWCDYSGVVDGQRIGITLMCHPKNFRPSRMHARDYGFLTANPFGQNVFDKGERSQVIVKPGETLRLRYGLLLHGGPASATIDLPAAYALYVKQSGE